MQRPRGKTAREQHVWSFQGKLELRAAAGLGDVATVLLEMGGQVVWGDGFAL